MARCFEAALLLLFLKAVSSIDTFDLAMDGWFLEYWLLA
jgi:hypothetical protein